MTQHGFRTTVSCHKREVLTVGGQWFLAEDVVTSDGSREVLVVSRHTTRQVGLQGRFLAQGFRLEIFPGVFVTFTDIAKKSRVRVLIEAPAGVAISRGYPRQLKVVPVLQPA